MAIMNLVIVDGRRESSKFKTGEIGKISTSLSE